MKNIMITGASGFVGSYLSKMLLEMGHRVTGLGTSPGHAFEDEYEQFVWMSSDTTRPGPWQDSVAGSDIVINLAGRNIFKPWTRAYKEAIYDSRVLTTRNLVEAMGDGWDGHLLSASAVGYYGDCRADAVTERVGHGDAFISDVCRRWEEAAEANWTRPGGRLVTLRIGVVLTPAGGALARLLPVFKAGLGGTIGSGNQYMSWISMEDVLGAMAHIIRQPAISGPVNLTAPHPVTNREFTKVLAAGVKRFAFTSLPASAVTCAFGDMGREVLLEGVKALPNVLQKTGYTFIHPTLAEALDEVL
jgi:uncharacterized protein (TIGR01777 family)